MAYSYIQSVFVPLVILLFLPPFLSFMAKKKVKINFTLVIACLLFFVSWYLPSFDIEGRYTAFTTHFVGGGLFTGVIWLYIRKQLSIKLSPFFDLVVIYFLVSGLGVANELCELLVTKIGIVHIDPFDTWWDLLANTLGAFTIWLGWSVYRIVKNNK